ncbi:MAG: rod shape-determining protein MreC [Deltaproteobacteria bacterium]|nr:rod shape-determining protein MreC [Deltaproteobacteria bacterium]
MPDLLKRMGAPLIVVFVVLLTIASMVIDRRSLAEGGRELPGWQAVVLEVTAPIQRVVSAPIDGVTGFFSDYVALLDVRAENRRLRRRIAEIESENLQFREALVTTGHLARVASMRDEIEIPMLPAEVVGLDVAPWFRSVLVDRGARHGVEPGHPVITHEGVVGVVTATSGNAAKTMLLLDRQSSVDALVQRSRARGAVGGVGRDRLEFEFVVRGADVVVGDEVVTSGLGGIYPKGLRIGRVSALREAAGRLTQIAVIEPAVDLGQLEQVFVMLRRGPTMDLLYRPNRAEQDLEGPVSTDGPPAGRAAETDSVGLAKPVTSVEDPS